MEDGVRQAMKIIQDQPSIQAAIKDPERILEQFAANHSMLTALIDLIVRPTHFTSNYHVKVQNDMPMRGSDFLFRMHEGFIDLAINGKIVKKEQELLGFEGNEALDKSEEVAGQARWWVMLSLHSSILKRQPQQTAYSYLSKIMGPIYYHRTAEVFYFYETHSELIASLIKQCHFAPIMDIFIKLIQAENVSKFFVDFKKKYLSMLYTQARQGFKDQEESVNWAMALCTLHRFINDRLQEQGDNIGKYSALLRATESGRMDIQQDIMANMESMSDEQVLWSLRWIEETLKHDQCLTQGSIHISINPATRKSSMSNQFYNDQNSPPQKNSPNAPFRLSDLHLQLLAQMLEQKVLPRYVIKEDKASPFRDTLLLICVYRILYFMTQICTRRSIQQPQLSAIIAKILTSSLLEATHRVIVAHPKSTILHNYAKEMIMAGIRQDLIPAQYFLTEENLYLATLKKSLPRHKQRSHPFGQQVYTIYQLINDSHPTDKEPPASLVQLQLMLTEQTARHNKVIGCDPKGDVLRNSANTPVSDCSQDIQFDIFSGTLNSGRDWLVESGNTNPNLKGSEHRRPSIEMSALQGLRQSDMKS